MLYAKDLTPLPGGLVELTCVDSSFLHAVAGSLRTLQVRTTRAEDDGSRLHNSANRYKIANAVIVVSQLPKR